MSLLQSTRPFSAAAAVLLIGATATPSRAQEGPQRTRVIALVRDKSAASLRVADLKLELNGTAVPINSVTPLLPSGTLSGTTPGIPLEIAVVLDESLRTNFDSDVQDVDKFVASTVGPNVAIGVGYARNGAVYFPEGFSHEPEVARRAIRLPLSNAGTSSPYFSAQDLVKHWPTHTGAARVILMITNGVDVYNGSVSPLNQDSPYVENTIHDANRAGVPIYAIYFGGRGNNTNFAGVSGQNYLSKVADETGGESLNEGTLTPPSLSPYFAKFLSDLNRSYLVEFTATNRKLDRLKLTTVSGGPKLRVPSEVQAGSGF